MKTGTRTIDDTVPTDYDGPFIPRGLAPGEPRTNDLALDFVKGSAETGRPIGALCHGPQLLISAGLAGGRRLTSWQYVEPEVTAAARRNVDEPPVEHGQFVMWADSSSNWSSTSAIRRSRKGPFSTSWQRPGAPRMVLAQLLPLREARAFASGRHS